MTLTFTLRHFQRIISVGALGKLVANSILISLLTGLVGTILVLTASYVCMCGTKAASNP